VIPQGLRPAGNWFETIISALIIMVAVGFLVFVYARTGTGHLGSYPLAIRLPTAAGLDVGKDVRVGGVKVGSISSLSLDPVHYSAIVEISVRDDLSLPVDSTATVSSTVLGESYLAIAPGHSTRSASPGTVLGQPPAKAVAPAART
jgi:phospholipid/cholesterol/gamma-HCH transport system substrate-binding protein